MGIDTYIYCADVYCEDCAREIMHEKRRAGTAPKNPGDQSSYDSDDYPKGPFSDEESDTPQHCASGPDCLTPTMIGEERVGRFLENPLTSDGERYVRELHAERPTEVTRMWMDFYELD